MNDNRNQRVRDGLVFILLVAIGVAGRWGQPEWCFTPTAAAAIFAGFYFARLSFAALVPITILGISDFALEAYDSFGVMIATYAVMTLPVLFGRWLRTSDGRVQTLFRIAFAALVPAILFWIVTNFAVWAFQSDYEKSWSGLMLCYTRAIPFFRWMLAGDVLYVAVLFGCAALAGLPLPGLNRELQPEHVRRD